MGPSAAGDLVARATQQLAADRGQVRMSVLAGIYETMINDLLVGKLDLIVAIRQVDRQDALVREEMLGDVRYVVVAGSRHRLAGKQGVSLSEVAGERWLAGANLGAVEQSIANSFRSVGARLAPAEIETTSVIFALAMLDAGLHLAILPEMLLGRTGRAWHPMCASFGSIRDTRFSSLPPADLKKRCGEALFPAAEAGDSLGRSECPD